MASSQPHPTPSQHHHPSCTSHPDVFAVAARLRLRKASEEGAETGPREPRRRLSRGCLSRAATLPSGPARTAPHLSSGHA
eukprot:321074-Rhodomonas_salina.2